MVLRMQKAHKLTKSDAVFHEVIPGMKRLLKGFGFFFEGFIQKHGFVSFLRKRTMASHGPLRIMICGSVHSGQHAWDL